DEHSTGRTHGRTWRRSDRASSGTSGGSWRCPRSPAAWPWSLPLPRHRSAVSQLPVVVASSVTLDDRYLELSGSFIGAYQVGDILVTELFEGIKRDPAPSAAPAIENYLCLLVRSDFSNLIADLFVRDTDRPLKMSVLPLRLGPHIDNKGFGNGIFSGSDYCRECPHQ